MKIGLLLSGCGMYDGSEAAEAILSLLALDRAGARAVCVAPGVDQMHVVDHLSGEEVEGERRSVLAESARLARGKVLSLSDFWSGDLQGLVIAGGYGAAKNLMTGFMDPARRREVIPEVRALLDDLTGRGKPLGAISLGRTVLCAYFDQEMKEDDLSMPATEVAVDEARRTAFTPGFLSAVRVADAARGIEGLVSAILRMASAQLPILR
ncbi:MAG: isoprenoid biosynthesis protein ElbB [Acidobacteria bacterium]|nr:isoprenoid biosynthesis protein ElbB [Acidobacteriota bacterium]